VRLDEGCAKGGNPRTLVLNSALHARFHGTPESMPADELKIIGNIIHFLSLHIGDNDVDVIAPVIVHPPEQHEFW
jgi:hypothetical protein